MVKSRWAQSLVLALVLFTGLFAAFIWMADPTQHAYFEDYGALEKTDLIAKGWIPGFVPASSKRISMEWEVETGTAAISFFLDSAEGGRLFQKLEEAGWRGISASGKGWRTIQTRGYELSLREEAAGLREVRVYVKYQAP